jgi:hypothetical protein
LEGTIIVVTDSPERIPDPKEITSKGQKIEEHNANLEQLEPTEKEFKVISTKEARLLFGSSSIRISGVSVSVAHHVSWNNSRPLFSSSPTKAPSF